MQIMIKRIHENAKLPKQGKPGDAAFDLCCVEDFSIRPGGTLAVSTGLVLANMPTSDSLNDSIFLQVVGRSGLALKGIFPIGGIIDSTYRGEIKVILHNGNSAHVHYEGSTQIHHPSAYEFKAGDRIASMLIQKVVTNDTLARVHFLESDEVTTTNRGSDGFGSTDIINKK